MKNTMCVLLSCAAVFAASAACFAESEPMLISPAPAAYEVSADGKVIDFAKDAPFEENGTVMVPVRKTAEALGFTVTWDGEHNGVKLDNGEVNTIIYIGTDSYYTASSTAIGMSAPESLGAAPVLTSKPKADGDIKEKRRKRSPCDMAVRKNGIFSFFGRRTFG